MVELIGIAVSGLRFAVSLDFRPLNVAKTIVSSWEEILEENMASV